MRWTAALALVACHVTTPVTAPPPPPRPTEVPPPPAPKKVSWATPVDRWLTTDPMHDVAVLDEHFAFAVVGLDRSGESYARSIARIDLATGEVVEKEVVSNGRAFHITREAGGKLILFGIAGRERAWLVDPQTLAISEITIANPTASGPSPGPLRVVVAPSGKRAILCRPGWGTYVRELPSLAEVRKIGHAQQCRLGFVDDATIWEERPRGAVTIELASGAESPYSGSTTRTVPTELAIPNSASRVVVLSRHQLGVRDPSASAPRTLADHDVGPIRALAFRDNGAQLVSLSDRVRVWDHGRLAHVGPKTHATWAALTTGGGTGPILASGEAGLVAWTPETGALDDKNDGHVAVIDRAGDRVVSALHGTASGGTVERRTPRVTLRTGARVVAVDATSGMLLVGERDGVYAIAPDTRQFVSLDLVGCYGNEMKFAIKRGGRSVAIADYRTVLRVDRHTGEVLGSLQEFSAQKVMAFTTDDELAIVEDRDRGGRVILWSPRGAIAVQPELPAQVTALAVDATAKRIAFGHADGSIEVHPLADLRGEGESYDLEPDDHSQPCSKSAKTYDELVR